MKKKSKWTENIPLNVVTIVGLTISIGFIVAGCLSMVPTNQSMVPTNQKPKRLELPAGYKIEKNNYDEYRWVDETGHASVISDYSEKEAIESAVYHYERSKRNVIWTEVK